MSYAAYPDTSLVSEGKKHSYTISLLLLFPHNLVLSDAYFYFHHMSISSIYMIF